MFTAIRRTLYALIAALVACFYAPLFSLFVAAIGVWFFGMQADTSLQVVESGCEFARATIGYAFLCGSN